MVSKASMRPEQLCPGNADDLGGGGHQDAASMRPEQLCPGNVATVFIYYSFYAVLQ